MTKYNSFRIYSESQINETITLFEMFKYITEFNDYVYTEFWAKHYMNMDMYDYAMRLALIKKPTEKFYLEPPYLTKPNFFFAGYTMATAYYLRDNFIRLHEYVNKHVQIKPSLYMATINSNYSGAERFVLYGDKIYHGIQYFTEDIELNSYYYGLHLLYPYWMSEADLIEMDMRYAEHYYFVHKQLLARYNLEMEQFVQINIHLYNDYEKDFDPQLMFERKYLFARDLSIQKIW